MPQVDRHRSFLRRPLWLAVVLVATSRASDGFAQNPPIMRSVRASLNLNSEAPGSPFLLGAVGAIGVGAGGQIFVLDRTEHDVKSFASDGRYVTTFGRRGEGPGEFADGAGLVVRYDTVVVLDYMQNREVMFSLGGRHLVTRSLPTLVNGEAFPTRSTALRHGYLFLPRSAIVQPGRTPLYDPYMYATVRYPGRGGEDTVARVRLDAVLVTPSDPKGIRAAVTGFGSGGTVRLIGDSALVAVDGYTGAIRWYSIEATGAKLLRADSLRRAPTPVSPQDLRAMQTRVSNQPFWRGRGALSFSDPPKFWSMASQSFVAVDGTFWTGAIDHRTRNAVWTALPPTGEGFRVEFPADFAPINASRTRVYGKSETSQGAPVVRVYDLGPASSSPARR